MDLKKFLRFLQPAIIGLVAVSRFENPTFTDDQIARDVEGDLKHFGRQRLGFIIDILFFDQRFRQEIRALIREAMKPETEEGMPPTQ